MMSTSRSVVQTGKVVGEQAVGGEVGSPKNKNWLRTEVSFQVSLWAELWPVPSRPCLPGFLRWLSPQLVARWPSPQQRSNPETSETVWSCGRLQQRWPVCITLWVSGEEGSSSSSHPSSWTISHWSSLLETLKTSSSLTHLGYFFSFNSLKRLFEKRLLSLEQLGWIISINIRASKLIRTHLGY